MNELVERMNGLCDDQPFSTNWYLKDLRTGKEANRNGDIVVPSASTRKIAILMAALKAVNEGRFTLDQPVKMEAKYQNNTSGVFQHLQPGFTIQFRDALVMMIIVSDNTCTGTVADMVGLDCVNELCESIGMKGTTHRHGIPPDNLDRNHPVEQNNATTPNDVGLLLDLILQGKTDPKAAAKLGCTPELCKLALKIMSWQKLRQRLPALLPSGAKVAHKTGTRGRNFNDAGVIYKDDEPRFILTVYTDYVPPELPDGTPDHAAAAQIISRLSRLCWDSLN